VPYCCVLKPAPHFAGRASILFIIQWLSSFWSPRPTPAVIPMHRHGSSAAFSGGIGSQKSKESLLLTSNGWRGARG
jgi:hypothetical protein